MKLRKTRRILSLLLTVMMMMSMFSMLSAVSASADDTPTAAYVVIKPTITTYSDALDSSKTFSVTSSVESRSSDIVYLSSPTVEQLETCEQDAINYGYAWNHCYKVTFRVYAKTGYDISKLNYIYVKDGKCSYYASLYKGSSDTGFYQNSGQNYVIANIIFIPFEVMTYKNSEIEWERFFGLEKARYRCYFSAASRHLTGYEMATTFYDDMMRTFNGYYPGGDIEPTDTGFYYSVPRSKSYTGNFGYYGVSGQTEGTKTIRSDSIRRRVIVAAMTEDCTAGTATSHKATCYSID